MPVSSEASFQNGVPVVAGGVVLLIQTGVDAEKPVGNAENVPVALFTVSANMPPLSATTAAAANPKLFIVDLLRL
jgi:hypothetical protein